MIYSMIIIMIIMMSNSAIMAHHDAISDGAIIPHHHDRDHCTDHTMCCACLSLYLPYPYRVPSGYHTSTALLSPLVSSYWSSIAARPTHVACHAMHGDHH